jgi:hypothetical protein
VYMGTSWAVVWWLRRCSLHQLAKSGPLSGMNELITRIAYVGPPQAEEFKYGKSLYLSNREGLP